MNLKLIHKIRWIITMILVACIALLNYALGIYMPPEVIAGLALGVVCASCEIGRCFDKIATHKAKQKIPELMDQYEDKIAELQKLYHELLTAYPDYETNITVLGLSFEGARQLTEEMWRRPVLGVIQYSQVLYEKQCNERLQKSIEYLTLKEDITKRLGSLGALISRHLTKNEKQVGDMLSWACEVAGIDKFYIDTEYFVAYDPVDDRLVISWPLTVKNLQTLLATLQSGFYLGKVTIY